MLYRYATQPEMEETFREWLRTTIARLESERTQKRGPAPSESPSHLRRERT